MISKGGAILWAMVVAALSVLAWVQVGHHWNIRTDILELFPKNERDPSLATLRQMAAGKMGQTVAVVVSDPDPAAARMALRQLGPMMKSSGLFSEVIWNHQDRQKAYIDFYWPLRYQFVSPEVRRLLQDGGAHTNLLRRLERELRQPTSPFVTVFLKDDPLLLFAHQLESWGRVAGKMGLDDGVLGVSEGGRFHGFISAKLAGSPFDEAVQRRLEDEMAGWQIILRSRYPQVEVLNTSIARFASAARRGMEEDMNRIGLYSTLGILFLVLVVFRSVKHLLLTLVPLAVSIWCALGLSLAVFGELHAVTLVFGASLTGVCVDYGNIYFTHHRMTPSWDAVKTMRDLLPALWLAALTTIISFAALAFTSLAGLRQIAFFSSCGILLAFLTVVFWFPLCFRHSHPLAAKSSGIFPLARWPMEFWTKHRTAALITMAVALALTIKGLINLKVNDNPTALSAPGAALVVEDSRIRELIGAGQTHGNIVVRGKSAEEALQNMERLQDVLAQAETNGWIDPAVSLSYFLPSKKRQEEDARLLSGLLTHEDEIRGRLDALGLPEENIQAFFHALKQNHAPPILPETWLSHPVSAGLRDLWLGNTADGVALLVQLRQNYDPGKFKAAIAGLPGVAFFNQEEDLTRLLGRYRVSTTWLVAMAYSLIFALLFWRCGWRGIAVILPSLLSAAITVGMIGLCGSPFTLMHCLALLLVLGMGVDYSIFFAEGDPDKDSTTFLCIVLCCATTVLSFGLLSLSSQAALHAIGLTTMIGIISAWLLAPIAIYARKIA